MKLNIKYIIPITLAIITFCQGCNSIDDNRIPNMPVSLSLSDMGLWNTFGVSGFGSYRIFTLSPRQPSDFPYTSKTYTGYGGVLLIEGLDPYTGISSLPLAYDLACPVERQSNTRVKIDADSYMAVCPVCGSTYDVTIQRGAPIAGPAATGEYKYALKSYNCIATPNGGYIITN